MATDRLRPRSHRVRVGMGSCGYALDATVTSRHSALALLVLALALLSPVGARAQASGTGTPGEWWLHTGFGLHGIGGNYGDVLEKGVTYDLSLAKGSGSWRFGGGIQFEGLQMRPPHGSQLEWARLELFGSAMRVFNPDAGVRPYMEVRPSTVRVHARSELFHNIPFDEFQEGHNPTPSSNGIGLTVRPGIEIDIAESFAFDLSGSFSAYTTGDYDLTPIGMPPVATGSEFGLRMGVTWRPLGRGFLTAPAATDTSPLPAPNGSVDAWGVPRSWGWATAEMLAINYVASMLNEYTRGESSYPVTPTSFWHNIEQGWKFDDNEFQTNQLIHPFNGATYFNSARTNGIGFWGASVMALVGAFVWECCGESQPQSWNDMLSTGLGGISRGELEYRASSLILDNTARGRERLLREVAAFPVNPIRSFNRLLSGRTTEVRGNPADPLDRRPPLVLLQLNAGARAIALGQSITDDTNTYGFMDLALIYGDPFENERRGPFDRFDAYVQLDAGDKTGIGRLQVRGDLWSTPLGGEASEDTRFTLAIAHDFDYVNNEAYQFGGQGLGLALFSRLGSFERRLTTRLSVTGVVGAAVNSDYAYILADIPDRRRAREYDYGTGLGIGFEALFTRSARTTARLDYRFTGIRVFNGSISNPISHLFDFGSNADHDVHRAGLEVLIAVTGDLSLGLQASMFYRDSNYDDPDLIDRTQRHPELRVYVSRIWR